MVGGDAAGKDTRLSLCCPEGSVEFATSINVGVRPSARPTDSGAHQGRAYSSTSTGLRRRKTLKNDPNHPQDGHDGSG
jgi:hypothetical protein